jgi:disulfide bond formation protein DsbB
MTYVTRDFNDRGGVIMKNIKGIKWIWPIILIFLFLISMGTGFYISTSMAFPQNPATYSYFEKICNMPYISTPGPQPPEVFWQQGGNCDDRALALKTYLVSRGAEDVQICWVCRMENSKMIPSYDGSYGHSFIVWNNKVYNPSINESRKFYEGDIQEFQKFLKELFGFNTWYFENQTVGSSF